MNNATYFVAATGANILWATFPRINQQDTASRARNAGNRQLSKILLEQLHQLNNLQANIYQLEQWTKDLDANFKFTSRLYTSDAELHERHCRLTTRPRVKWSVDCKYGQGRSSSNRVFICAESDRVIYFLAIWKFRTTCFFDKKIVVFWIYSQISDKPSIIIILVK